VLTESMFVRTTAGSAEVECPAVGIFPRRDGLSPNDEWRLDVNDENGGRLYRISVTARGLA
jgi:hypothetical protein